MYSLLLLLALAACSSKENGRATILEAPTQVHASVAGETSALLEWTDNCATETGYFVFLQQGSQPAANLPAGSTSYTFSDLTPGTSYRLGVQAYAAHGALSQAVYADALTLPVPEPTPDPEPEPEADPVPDPSEIIELSWTEVTDKGLPASVKLYKTTDALEGSPFNAWYAVADCSASSGIEFRVLNPGGGKTSTLDAQAEAQKNCLVLINGGIFGTAPIGFAILDGEQTPWREVHGDDYTEYVDKQAWGAVPGSAYNRLHPVSRGLFGVDAEGRPGVYWSYTPSWGTVYCYPQPIPTVAGESVKPEGSTTYPCNPVDWTPYNAITCGPVLLQEWTCPISAEKTDSGHWKTNYELWADDIFGVDSKVDRTAVGFRSDGSVVLLICDGRIAASKGATTLQLAKIMRGLGCKGALNLDGGGSTGMWVKGEHINDLTGGNRPLMTTLGFFSK